MQRWMALDVGDRTIGVAISDALGYTAQGITTVMRQSWKADLDELARHAREHDVTGLVIGLPLNMDGTEGPRCQKSREFAERATAALGLPVEFWDERLTTAEVQRMLITADVSRTKRKKVVDKLAAQVILQGFLESRRALPTAPAHSGDAAP